MASILYPAYCERVNHKLTFDKQVGSCSGRSGHKLVLSSVSKVNVPYGEGVRELPAADLTPLRRLHLHPVLQPFVGDALIVDSDLKGDGVPLLSIQVLQHGGDEDRWRGGDKSSNTEITLIIFYYSGLYM